MDNKNNQHDDDNFKQLNDDNFKQLEPSTNEDISLNIKEENMPLAKGSGLKINMDLPQDKKKEKKQKLPTLGKTHFTNLANVFYVLSIIGLFFNLLVLGSFIAVALYIVLLVCFLIITLGATYSIVLPLISNTSNVTAFMTSLSVATPYVAWTSIALSALSILIFSLSKNYTFKKRKIGISIVILILSIGLVILSYLIKN